jgi:carboxylesterase type B
MMWVCVALLFGVTLADPDVVAVSGGRILGVRDANNDVRFWKGVPFGAPTGPARRFMPPIPPSAWPDVLNCTVFGPGCVSDHHGVDVAPVQSEDCLNLNIYVPLRASLQVRSTFPISSGLRGSQTRLFL